MRVTLLIATLFCSSVCLAFPTTPRIWDSPGKLCTLKDKDFDRLRYPEGIAYCRRNVSVQTKDQICASYGIYNRRDFTVDHIIPLSLGGSNHVENLWCQSRKIITANLEFYYYRKVSEGSMRQVEAVHALLAWKFNPRGKDHIPKPPDNIYPIVLNNDNGYIR